MFYLWTHCYRTEITSAGGFCKNWLNYLTILRLIVAEWDWKERSLGATFYLFSGLLYSPVSVLPNMKLAEFRYGREEMLALFDKNVRDILWSSTLAVWTCEVNHPLELTVLVSVIIPNTKSMTICLTFMRAHGAGEISRGVGTVWQSLRGEDTVST